MFNADSYDRRQKVLEAISRDGLNTSEASTCSAGYLAEDTETHADPQRIRQVAPQSCPTRTGDCYSAINTTQERAARRYWRLFTASVVPSTMSLGAGRAVLTMRYHWLWG